jgi:hypothetical protein
MKGLYWALGNIYCSPSVLFEVTKKKEVLLEVWCSDVVKGLYWALVNIYRSPSVFFELTKKKEV